MLYDETNITFLYPSESTTPSSQFFAHEVLDFSVDADQSAKATLSNFYLNLIRTDA